MSKAYLPFDDFFTSSFCAVFLYACGVVALLCLFFNWPSKATAVLIPIITILMMVGMYQIVFVGRISISNTILLTILGLPFPVILVSPEAIGCLFNAPTLQNNTTAHINSWYALIIALFSYAWGYLDSHCQIKKHAVSGKDPIELWTYNLYMADHSFEDTEVQKSMVMIASSWTVIGFAMVCVLYLSATSAEIKDVQVLIVKMACTLLATILLGYIFLALGQNTCVLQLEWKTGKPFAFRNTHLRLKWRHDYVKYHLPSPIRKLNLRIFNQHVEVYEELLKQSGHKPKHRYRKKNA